jgi:hypothetical protein
MAAVYWQRKGVLLELMERASYRVTLDMAIQNMRRGILLSDIVLRHRKRLMQCLITHHTPSDPRLFPHVKRWIGQNFGPEKRSELSESTGGCLSMTIGL